MPLILPPAFSLNNLAGGYNSNADFMTLQDSQTNDAKNVEITRTKSIRKRSGYNRMLNTALAKTGLKSTTLESGDPIKGVYQIVKSGTDNEVKATIVAAGTNLWSYTSATANIIMSKLSDSDNALWNFIQIQDPRSGTSGVEDVLIGTNGENPPVIWNGTETSATYLSSVTGSSGVATGKFIASLFNRVYFLNIKDSTDADANSKFIMSGFDTNGVPTPHIFPPELFAYCGGSDQYGEINGVSVLEGSLIIFKRNAIYTFTPGSSIDVDVNNLAILHDFAQRQLDQNVGCIAPGSIATTGNSILFLSSFGVMAFDGQSIVNIGQPIEQDLLDINFERRSKAQGIFYREKNQYWLSITSSDRNYNDIIFVYDLTQNIWLPPYINMKANVLGSLREENKDKIICGDHEGYVYRLDSGNADGIDIGFNLIPTSIDFSATRTIINFTADLPTAGDKLFGIHCIAIDGEGVDAEVRTIISSTKSQIIVSPAFRSAGGVTTATTFSIGGIDSNFRTKDFSLGSTGLDKLHRSITIRTKQLGNYDLKTQYIVDFNEISNAGTASINIWDKNYITFGSTSTFGNAKFGPAKNAIKRQNLKFLNNQSLVGKYFALNFKNQKANEPWEIYNLDILAKEIGRRT